MNSCSICAVAASAQLVNEMLHAKKLTLKQIAEACGHSKSSVHRHSKSAACPLGYQAYRAALVKSKGKAVSADARWLVQWEDGTIFTLSSQKPVAPSEVKPSDIVLVVVRRKTPLARLGNPRAIELSDENFAEFFDLACAEDLERSQLSVANSENAS
jgi:hypothetical protein